MEAVGTAAAGALVNVSRVPLAKMYDLPDSVLAKALQRIHDEFTANGNSDAGEAGSVRVPVAAFNSSFTGRS